MGSFAFGKNIIRCHFKKLKSLPFSIDFFGTIYYNKGEFKKRKVDVFMKAVITVTGKDTVGIIADVAAVCAKYRASILDITQSVLSEYFAMIMLADIDALDVEFADFADALTTLGEGKGLMIHAMHEDIFNTMHHI